jgi:carboxylesterase
MVVDTSPFDFDGDARGVLCVHGFTATPYEMRHLGERLHQRGMTVRGLALPGHCTSPAELDATTWRDWYAAVEREFTALRQRCAHVAVVGQSLGGLLSLHLAHQRGSELCGLAVLAAPLWLRPLPRLVVALTRRFPGRVRYLPKLGSDARDPWMRRHHPSYRVIPVRALHQLDELMTVVTGELPHIAVPTLVVHSRADHTAPYRCSERIHRELGTALRRHRQLTGSYHLLSVDLERDTVAGEVSAFFEARFREAARRKGQPCDTWSPSTREPPEPPSSFSTSS